MSTYLILYRRINNYKVDNFVFYLNSLYTYELHFQFFLFMKINNISVS